MTLPDAIRELKAAATAYATEAKRYRRDQDRYEDVAHVQQRLFVAAELYEVVYMETSRTHACEPMDLSLKAGLIDLRDANGEER